MEKSASKTGKLIYLGMPIGNVEDLTLRQRSALETGEFFAVEDTRTFKQLLNMLGISYQNKQIISWHDQSSSAQVDWAAKILLAGGDVYVASEAGSPIISDPGHDLMRQLRDLLEDRFTLETFPGASSVMAALELSEFPPFPFHFHGFFPRKDSDKMLLSQKISMHHGVHLFFESPHRILETRIWMEANWRRENVAILRELTKEFQSVYHLKHFGLQEELPNLDRGELVLAYYIDLKHQAAESEEQQFLAKSELRSLVEEYLRSKKDKKSLAHLFSELLGSTSKEWYRKLNEESND
jgi:16S rRNA (cytidine1402-2'-O)-methyltransferase